jgi:hypothetical membrane protein
LPSRKITKQKIGAVARLLAPILAFTCILTVVASHPSFSWTNNALSDLGIISGITGPLFNFGLYAGGFLALIFAVFGLFTYLKESFIGRIGTLAFTAATIALIAIGVFNESFSGIHYDVSVAFFVLVPISLFLITRAFLLDHRAMMTVFTVASGVIAALPWIVLFAFRYVRGVAIPETVSGLLFQHGP